jgi:hypothetical protein
MNNDEQTHFQASTIGTLAKLYNIHHTTLMDLINAHEDLKKEIELYTKDVKHKAKKVLPPLVIALIYKKIGEP